MPICKLGDRLILFIHVPRTGGTTIEHHLGELGTVFFKTSGASTLMRVTAQHFHARDLKTIFPEGLFDYVFMVVRHPVSRILSEYAYERSMRPNGLNLPFSLWLRLAMMRSRVKPHWRDNHLRAQIDFECFGAEIFKFEEGVDKVFDRLQELFGIEKPRKIQQLQKRGSELPTIRKKDANLVYEFYNQDFIRYGYRPADFMRDVETERN
jgi:hypothetical protein